jgi:hypothetical protein
MLDSFFVFACFRCVCAQPATTEAFHGLLRRLSRVAVAALTARGPAQEPQLVRALFNCAKV